MLDCEDGEIKKGLATNMGEIALCDVTDDVIITSCRRPTCRQCITRNARNINIDTYIGVPFAEPPTGAQRFRPPVALESWEGTWNATFARDACAQAIIRSSEDCLHLNVYVPENAPPGAAVMVWFHGGGYSLGISTSTSYDPISLLSVASDVIFVSANYRLGVLGFLSTGDASSPGNYGLLDQVEALKWVQINIAAFGGDPSRVTIFGESAGAASVSLHLVSPLTQGYFNRAIMQSGTFLSPWAFDYSRKSERSLSVAKTLAGRVNCPTDSTSDMVTCLRSVPDSVIIDAQQQMISEAATTTSDLVFKPVVDDFYVTDAPDVLLQKGALHPADILIGTNRDEGSLFALNVYSSTHLNTDKPPIIPLVVLRDLLPGFSNYNHPQLLSAIEHHYIDWSIADNSTEDQYQAFASMTTDNAFVCPTDNFARMAAASGNRTVFMYHLTHVPQRSMISITGNIGPKWLGVGHAEDLQFIFMYGLNSERAFVQSPEDLQVGLQMVEYWTNFIKHGSPDEPNTTPSDPWTPYRPPSSTVYKELSSTMKNGRALKAKACEFWNSYLPKLATFTANSTDLKADWSNEVTRWQEQDMADWYTSFNSYKDGVQ
ncbi:cholinesterase 1-like [Asterias rubens]|uniref:cholinesterase 1-like n=1 Tax=Asterias rubens TaxID=7604 RepID=UPI0014550A48|nr:cholinesterase 1-like [Asterias rubens]